MVFDPRRDGRVKPEASSLDTRTIPAAASRSAARRRLEQAGEVRRQQSPSGSVGSSAICTSSCRTARGGREDVGDELVLLPACPCRLVRSCPAPGPPRAWRSGATAVWSPCLAWPLPLAFSWPRPCLCRRRAGRPARAWAGSSRRLPCLTFTAFWSPCFLSWPGARSLPLTLTWPGAPAWPWRAASEAERSPELAGACAAGAVATARDRWAGCAGGVRRARPARPAALGAGAAGRARRGLRAAARLDAGSDP